jgi:two-component system, response regulator YesN
MYTLLLVDDEANVREGVVQEIDWEHCGFEVVGIAENGKEAYELTERLRPDVIVTDIMMPYLDGIGLSRLVRENYPRTKIILLTGFDEFEYAQQAVKLQIKEYVLKPFSSQELIDALFKVKSLLDHEKEQRENSELLLQHYKESLPILRNNFLNALVTRQIEKQEILKKFQNYNISLMGDLYAVSILHVDRIPSTPLDHTVNKNHNYKSLKHLEDREVQLFAVLDIAEEICNQRQIGIVFILNEHVVYIASYDGLEKEQVLNHTFSILEEIRMSTEEYLGFSITIGVGTVNSDVANLKNSHQDAVQALDYRQILGNNRIIYIGDVEQRTDVKVEFDDAKEKELICYLKIGSISEIKTLFDSYFQLIEDACITFRDLQINLIEILTAILKVARDLGIDMDEILGNNDMLLTELRNFNNLTEAKQWFYSLCNRVVGAIATERMSKSKNLIDLAKDYIEKMYHESDISISMVCNHLHISTGYFSYLFKKEMKTTFVNYLTNIRMETARELLQTSDLKSFEIAERVGYLDPNYFSFCFKKYFGMTPKECRSMASRL